MKKIFNVRVLALLLIAAVVFVPLLSQTVASASENRYGKYEFSNSNSNSNTVLDVEYFIKLLGGSASISDIEREYLKEKYSEFTVKYDEPKADKFTITALNDMVTVTASPYTYKASNGVTITWYPVSVSLEGTNKTSGFTLNNGKYIADIAGVDITDSSAVVVEYKMDRSIEVDMNDLNETFNYTYNEAEKIKSDYIAAENEYNVLKQEYDVKLAEYEAWLNRTPEEIAAEWEAYNKYLNDLAIYQEKLASYNSYLTKLAAYQVKLDAYNAYLVALEEYNYYNNYKSLYPGLLDAYNLNVVAYRNYIANIAKVKDQISIFETGLFDQVTSLERDLFSCIMGDTVNSVLNREDEIVTGVPSAKGAIRDAGNATDVLKAVLGAYTEIEAKALIDAEAPARAAAADAAKNKKFASDEEKAAYIEEYVSAYTEAYVYAQKYAFYSVNYNSIKDNIILLAQTLHDLYRYDFIRTAIHTGVEGSGGKTDKYVIMVSQLILFANAITDSDIYSYPDTKHTVKNILLNNNTTIEYLTGELLPYKKVTKTVLQILENDEYVKDTNSAAPISGGCPLYTEEPVAPTHPDDMVAVPKPAPVKKPTSAPTPVEEPVKPEEVINPDLNVVLEPVAPQKPAILDDAHSKAVIAALNNGTIVNRDSLDKNYTFTPTVSLVKKIVNDENVSVTFYGNDPSTVLSKVIAPLYSTVSYSGATPTKNSTATEDYTFNGWVDASGNPVNLKDIVSKDLSLYPSYSVTKYVIVKFFDTDRTTLLSELRIKKGGKAVYNGELPTKTSDDAVHKFEKWVDANNNDVNFESVNDSVSLYPCFTSTNYVYVKFYAENKTTVLETVKLLPGKNVTINENIIPSKPSTAEEDYAFAGWVDAAGKNYGKNNFTVNNSTDLDLYPSFNVTKFVNIVFYDLSGKVLDSYRVRPGNSVKFNGSDPVRANTDLVDYTFSGWTNNAGVTFVKGATITSGVSLDLYPTYTETHYVRVNFYDTDRSTVLSSQKILKESGVIYGGKTPVKTGDDAVYAFDKWVGVNGNAIDLTSINSSIDLYPSFNATYYIYVRFYAADNATVLHTVKILPGQSAKYEGSVPVKANTTLIDYTFSGWKDNTGAAYAGGAQITTTVSLDLYPTFSETHYVIVNFYNTDRASILLSQRILKGGDTVYSGNTPVKTGDDAVYTFAGWSDANGNRYSNNISALNNSVDLYPEFNATYYIYVRFYSENKTTVLYTVKLLPGQSASYVGDNPTKDSTETADYTFTKWVDSNGVSPNLTYVTESLELYPEFAVTSYVVVKFYDVHGNLIEKHRVIPGTPVAYCGSVPTKESIDEADYIFSAWKDQNGNSYELSNPRSSVDLYPEFTEIPYIVIYFYDTDGETLIVKKRVRPGSSVIFDGKAPVKDPLPEIGYTFSGWQTEDGNFFDLSAPVSSVKLYPVFIETYFIELNFYDADGNFIAYHRVLKGHVFNYSDRIPTKDSAGDIDYEFDYWQDADGVKYDLNTTDYSADLYPVFREIRYVNVNFYDTDGTLLETQVHVRVGTSIAFNGNTPVKDSEPEADYTFAAWMDVYGNRYYTVPDADIDLYPSFDVTRYVVIRFFAADNTTVIYETRVLPETQVSFTGSNPLKDSTDLEDYTFLSWVDKNGENVNSTVWSDVSMDIYPSYTTVKYARVNFYSYDGSILDSYRVRVGDSVVYGKEDPVRPGTDVIDYAFSGWVYENGDDADLSEIYTSVDVYASFAETHYVIVNFYNTDSSLISSHKILKGSAVAYTGVTPVKTGDDAVYTFEKWVDVNGNEVDFSSVNESVDLYPDFSAIYYIYVTFYAENKTTALHTAKILPGQSAYYVGDLPTKNPTAEIDYNFGRWVDADGVSYDLASVSKSLDLYPEFEATYYCIVNFYDTDGVTVIGTFRVLRGSGVVYTGDTPVKTGDDAVYTFAGWTDSAGNRYNNSISELNSSVDLYPDFSAIYYIYVTFYAENKIDVLHTVKLLPGQFAKYEGADPVKANTEIVDYSFSGWTDNTGALYAVGAQITTNVSLDLYPEFDATYYAIVRFYDNNKQLIEQHRVLVGNDVSFGSSIPTKPEDYYGVYTFSHWIDADGDNYSLENVGESVDLYPSFGIRPYLDVLFYAYDRVTVLGSNRVLLGDSLEYIGSLPVRETDDEGRYSFLRWVDAYGNEYDFSSVNESVSLYPEFTLTPYIVITFIGADGSVLDVQKIFPGEGPVIYGGSTPIKESIPTADYTFAGNWIDEDGNRFDLSDPTESANVYPEFYVTQYNVINFYAYDGVTVLYSLRQRPEEAVVYSADTPIKPDTDLAVYKFSYWAYEDGTKYNFEKLSTSADFYPVFDETPYVTITFLAFDGVTVLYTVKLLQGMNVMYAGETPVKPSDENFAYTFASWAYANGEEYTFSSEATVTVYPVFRSTPYVTVIFTAPDGETVLDTQRVLLGTEVVFAGILSLPESDLVYDYLFDAWLDENGQVYDLSAVAGNVTLRATIKNVLREDYEIVEDEATGLNQYNVDLGEVALDDIPLAAFISHAKENMAVLNITASEVTVRFAYTQVSAMAMANVASISITFQPIGGVYGSNAPRYRARNASVADGYVCVLLLKDADGNPLDVSATATITVDCQDAAKADLYCVSYIDAQNNEIEIDRDISGSIISFEGQNNVKYTLRIKYDINLSPSLPSYIQVTVDKSAPGDKVNVNIASYESLLGKVLTLYYTCDDSTVAFFERTEIRSMADAERILGEIALNMPDGDIFIECAIEDILYTVTFKSEGNTVSERGDYKYGQDVLVPPSPIGRVESAYGGYASYKHTFIGWSPEISEVTGDVTYEAQFEIELEINTERITKDAVITAVVILFVSVMLLFIFTSDKALLIWKV